MDKVKDNVGHPWKYGLDYMEEKLDGLLKDMEGKLSSRKVNLHDYIIALSVKNIECSMIDIRHYFMKDGRKWPMLPFKLWLRFKWGIAEFEVYNPDKNMDRSVQLSWWNIYGGKKGKGIETYNFC